MVSDTYITGEYIDSQTPLAADGSYTITRNITLPNNIALAGERYLLFVADGSRNQSETNDNNNAQALPITLGYPDLIPSITGAPSNAISGTTIPFQWTVKNQGLFKTPENWKDRVYLSRDNNWDNGDLLLGEFSHSGSLTTNESYRGQLNLNLPIEVSGDRYLILVTDGTNQVTEPSSESNNITTALLQVQLAPYADLRVFDVTAPSLSVGNPVEVTIDWKVDNIGTGTGTVNNWVDRIVASEDNVVGNGDDKILKEFTRTGLLGVGESYFRSETITLPVNFQGHYRLFVQTDAKNTIFENNLKANNAASAPNFFDVVTIPYADLVVSSVTPQTTGSSGQTLSLSWVVTNLSSTNGGNGIGPTNSSSWTDTVSLASDPEGKNIIANLGNFDHSGILALGGNYTRTANVTLPNGLQGNYYLVVNTNTGVVFEFIYNDNNRRISAPVNVSLTPRYEQVVRVTLPSQVTGEWYITPWSDAYDVILEDTRDTNINPDDPNELDNNNYKARPITVLLTPPPDLVVTSVIAPSEGLGGKPFTVKWTVKNEGAGETDKNEWTDRVYLSNTPTISSSSQLLELGNIKHNGKLGKGEIYTGEYTFDLTPPATGNHIIVTTDVYDNIWEGPYGSNNNRSQTTNVTASPADLQVTKIEVLGDNFSGEKTTIKWTVTNQGATVWDGTRYWLDDVYISSDPNITNPNVLRSGGNQPLSFYNNPVTPLKLGSFAYRPIQPLKSGESYTQTQEVTLPPGVGGKYYFYVVTNPQGRDKVWSYWDNDNDREDFRDQVYENPANNIGFLLSPIIYREPDLQVTKVIVPSETPKSGQTIPIKWTVTNLGNRDTRQAQWIDRVYLSSDPSLDGSDRNLGEYWRGSKLAAGDSYQGSLNVTLPDGVEGNFYILVFSDSNIDNSSSAPYNFEYDWRSGIDFDYSPYRELARVPEFRDEGNNITAVPLPINLAVPPDLQVTTINIPERVITGQSFNVTYTVSNKGEGDTPLRQSNWTDLIYLSRDPFLDLQSDRYLGYEDRTGGLTAGNSYSVTKTFRAPSDLTGPFYVFVVTDSPRDNIRGKVFEGNQEGNNATPSTQPLILQLPPPSDLQVENITLPSLAQSGEPITIEWTVNNKGEYKAEGEWTDAVYLSADETWDINDTLIGRSSFKGLLNSNQSYTSKLQSILPPAPLGQYRIIVRPDIFNQVYEGTNEANNRTTSSGTITVTVPELQLGVPLQTTLNTGQERLFRVNVGLGQTLQVNLTSTATEAANELFVRFDNAPTGIVYDASYSGQLIPNQEAVIPTTKPGTYYVLVRGQSEPQNNTPVTLFADTIPFSITDIETDRGGDSRYVTTTIKGAQFNPKAIVKLVRPGFAEYEPVRYEVLDSTEIRAIFDLTSAFHGLYDVKVINPDGQQAIVPYRYLIERAIEHDIDIGLGGPRVLAPGDKGTYGVSVKSLTNIDTPYVHFKFGVPELGKNGTVFNFPYLNFYSNLRGQPENQNLEDVPWASLISDINTTGENLAPGYVLDLPTGGFIGQTFNAQTYPGISALLAQDFLGLRLALEEQYPNLKGQIEKPEDLDKAVPGLYQTYRDIKQYNPLSEEDPFDVAFQFSILASATALTRQEFIDQQTAEALKLRNAILNDASASQGLVILAANADTWVKAYLAALETSGLLRPENQSPPVRQEPLVISLMATLATGILAGPEGDRITTNGDLVSFFEQVRKWYGHNSTKIGQQLPPNPQDYDLGLTQDTHFEAFNIYVPFSNKVGSARLDLPPFVAVPPPSFTGFLNRPGTVSQQAILLGPVSDSKQNFLPQNQPLPYTIQFENAATASAKVGEIRIVTQLDSDLEPRTFQLGDLKIGDIQVNIPNGRGSFDGDFDFIRSKGFILRVSGGLDPLSNTATWLLQAIDPDTGELVQNPNLGLLSPNNASGIGQGFVAYTVQPKTDVNTRTEITSQARVIFNTAAPFDTQTLSYLLDAQAPTTTVTVQPLSQGSSDYQVTWKAIDDNNGSGIKHVTVYVAKDGGNLEIWQRQTPETSAIYQGEAGHNYEFIALATDSAGNREQPRLGIQPPDDGSSVNLGTLPNFDRTSTPDLGKPPSPTPQPSTNPLFTEAEKLIPSVVPTSRQSEFESILQPFTSQAFVTGIRQSHGNIGPMAIAVKPDGSALISGGSGRNEIYLIPPEGLAGNAGGNLGASLAPLQVLPYPIFDLAFDPQGNLWATTGGNGLLKLNAETGAIVKNYGESITQTLAIDAATGTIYVSAANGVEIFDPTKESFSHFSDIRVGNLAFDNQGNLWGATWPNRGDIIRFDKRGKAQKMLEFNNPVDSLSFGKAGTKLEGLLFISNNSGVKPNTDSQLIMVDVATLRQVSLAKGGSRGDIIKTTADGRILLSQSHQIDVISPLVAPRVAYTNPAPNANLTLPENTITVVFDQDMLVGTATDAASILNPANYQLAGQTVGNLTPLSVIYDPATRSALLNFETLIPDQYELRVENSLRSKAGLAMPEDYISKFTAISDFLPFVNFQFNTPRSDRANQTVSYDVTITSKGDSDLLLPLVLLLDPSRQFTGQPLGATGKNEEGAYLIHLSDSLPNGRLKPGQSITGKVITVKNPDNLRVDFTPGLYALPYPNLAPNFTSSPVINGTAGQPYSYQVKAQDPDGVALAYLLYDGPQGMTLNATTGVINWTPTATSAVETPVTLRVYDSRGGYGTQSFKIKVEGGNHKPILQPLPTQIEGQEGESLQIGIAAIDEDNNPLIFWADNLPGGAVFDGTKGLLTWTPDYEAAGTYENVTFFVSDGLETVSQSTQIRIAPINQAPTLIRPSDRIVREGDKVRLQLTANDPEKAELKYSSNLLPGGAKLDPKTGLFEWTPAYFQAGEFEIPFSVSDGEKTTKQNVKITVFNANAVPVFDEMGTWQIKEGQLLYIQAFAFDPDNPSFALPFRLPDGSLTPLEGSEASVTYTVSTLPNGGTFDTDTATLKWTPNFTSVGNYTITVTATDDGNGTGNKASASINIPIRVENTNRIPEITPIGNKTLQQGEVLEIPIQVTDPDGNPIVITAQGLPGFGIPSFATFTDNKDGTGLLRFAPSLADDSGDYTITLKVSDDGDGGKSAVQSQEYTFIVSVAAQNDSPRLSRISDKVAVVGTPLQFEIEANDKNQDSLSFSAIGLPTGATLTSSNVYGKAEFSWTPTASSLGSYPITIKVTDSGNGDSNKILSNQKAFNLVVRNSNQNPVLAPITSQTIDEGKTLQLTVSATDSEGDSLTYTATNLPQGAILDPVTGSLTWTPKYADAGTYKDIAITATDGNKSSTQLLTIQANNVNQKPVLIPVPIQAGREKSAIQFFLSGNDADGDSLSYSAVTKLPDGAFFDTRTQQFRWTPGYEQAGEYKVRFAVFDPQGASDTIDVTLKVDNVNRSPSLKVSNHNAVLGKELKFNLIGSDPDLNTTLTYSVTDLPEGATFNPKTGEFRWLPNPGQVGDYPLTFGVSDGESSVTERVLIHGAIAPEPLPVTIELTPSFPAIPEQKVLIHAIATSLADIATINLTVNGQPLTLDSQGRGEFTPNTPGQYLVTAKATDVDGFAGQTTSIIKVRNPQDNLPPVVAFLNNLEGEKITNVTSIVGTVADLNLDEWSLELATLGSNHYVKLADGNQAIATAPLTQLDPTTLSNGFYQLKLNATDISGRTSLTTAIIEINTSQKSSQYQRSETDLTVTLDGVNLDLIRAYDSLNSSQSATFGQGWRLTNTDTQIQTNVPSSGRENLGVYNPFRVGTRLYLTLPNGERVGFTFQPQRQEIPGLVYYTPAWVADTGVNYTLQSQNALLSLAGERLYELKTGQPYNPTTVRAQALHPSPSFTLTAPDGTIYHLDAIGKVQAQITPNGVKLTYSDSGIISPSGESVGFIEDAEGRLSQISAPDGRIITYKYDAQGNLVNVRNLALAQSNYYSYSEDNRLTLVAAANQPGATITYNTPQPQVITLTGNLGSAFQFNPTVTQGQFKTGEIQRYSFSVRQSEVNSTATGIVLLGVEVKGNNIDPNLPLIQGLTPLSSQLNSNIAFSLFAVDQESLNLLEIQGNTGNYSLQVFVAGDVNQDGLVDGVDGQLLMVGLGRKVGEAGYSLNLDVNRDGTINATDVQILGSNFGFKANQSPVVKTTSLLTHEDLQVTVPLINLAEDLEGDEVFYRVLNPVNGTVGMTPNGKGAIFTPSADYTGTASFELIADDGFSSSQPVTVTVNVSDAALIDLDIQNRNPLLDKGERTQLIFIGDFADQKDVILPSNYLTLASSNPTAATINPSGQVLGLAEGNGVISVSRNGIQAVTAFNVGIPTEAIEQAILVLGLGKYPETLALPSQVGTRQLKIDVAGQIDLTKAEQGTRYYVGNSDVVSVSADGLVTAKNPGLTTITVINGGSEALIPVKVTNPLSGPVVISNEGGVVQGADGSLISIGPETIAEGVTVSINAIGVDSLPYLIPEPFQALKAFELNLGNKTLNQPIQLAIPVDSSLAVGAEVYFFRASTVPDENGNEQPVWLQLEKGIVGSDGYARTSSPPFTGIWGSGTYFMGYAPRESLSVVNITLEGNPGNSVVIFKDAPAPINSLQTQSFSIPEESIIQPQFLGGLMASIGMMGFGVTFVPGGYKLIEVRSIPEVGLPTKTTFNLELKPGTNTLQLPITLPPVPKNPLVDPVILSAKLEITETEPQVTLYGDRFKGDLFTPNGAATPKVYFHNLNGTKVEGKILSATNTKIQVSVPQSIVIGLADVSVVRPGFKTVTTPLQVEKIPTDFESNRISFENYLEGKYAVSALRFKRLGFIDQETGDIVARLTFQDGVMAAQTVAPTPDLTRVYAPRGNGLISVVDMQALRQVDIDPNTPEIDSIRIAGASPYWAISDNDGDYLYVSDRLQPLIYVIDIQADSATYHQLVHTISVDAASGIPRLAFNSDGTKLYATAPAQRGFGSILGQHQQVQSGNIIVIDVNPESETIWQQTKVIAVGREPYAIITTPEPNVMLFTNRSEDRRGLGILRNDVFVDSVDLTLGSYSDYLDVNNASGIAFLPAGTLGASQTVDYAFVSAFNTYFGGVISKDPNYNPYSHEDWFNYLSHINYRPAGGNVGIIRDPLNKTGQRQLYFRRS